MLVVWIILSHCTNQDSGSCVLWSPALIILRYLDFSVGEDKIHYYCYYYCHYYHRASAVAFSISRYTGGRKYEKYTHDMRHKILCVQCQDRVRNYWGGSFAFLIVNQQWRKMAAAAAKEDPGSGKQRLGSRVQQQQRLLPPPRLKISLQRISSIRWLQNCRWHSEAALQHRHKWIYSKSN